MTTGFGELSFDPVFVLGGLRKLYKVPFFLTRPADSVFGLACRVQQPSKIFNQNQGSINESGNSQMIKPVPGLTDTKEVLYLAHTNLTYPP